ncbi:nicotinate phosphoribosyltransferase [Mycoplasmopsis caviae]|uniref:Nicotinate phosphoribosyltransferase n=1 Tax=Mycoplasmopsis caviae TaxID=55603 RepID=A0A3P8MFC8_9BACT|nr:nicotinate phosphoribosyltransferase [Mycoplasmopsis caviae]VDR42373.1 nicotinic acid phosphoribosyltransferase [Mycoplasmopsis caviae]
MTSKKMNKYIASYFHKTEKILAKYNKNNVIVLQFFQRRDNSLLAGMQEVLDLLEKNTDTSKYIIRYLPDGTIINNLEVVLELEGHYHDFGKFEGLIDGILTRSTSIASNAYDCVQAAKGKNVIFMGDRADHYLMQEIDGRAVALAGIKSVSTEAQNILNNESTFGSVPHILIQNFGGNTAKAMQAYSELFPQNKIISLVDYHNNVIEQALESYKVLGNKLWGVRIDTSKNMVDHMFDNQEENPEHYGVNIEQVKNLRSALDKVGANDVKIVVSSGFNAAKIKKFEEADTPVDSYGVGAGIFKFVSSFSADAVLLNGKKEAKEGREYRPNPKLQIYHSKK